MTHKESKVPCLNSDDRAITFSTIASNSISYAQGTSAHMNNIAKRPRTREDFYKFCTFILEYENYGRQRHDEENRTRTPPPLDSSGSSVNSESATSSGQEEDKHSEDDTDGDQEPGPENNDDSYDLVTCYCRKPFAGRPMIECSRCLTWVHLSCARIRRTHIPDVFYCALCKHTATANAKVRSPTGNTNRSIAAQTSASGSPLMKRVKRGASF